MASDIREQIRLNLLRRSESNSPVDPKPPTNPLSSSSSPTLPKASPTSHHSPVAARPPTTSPLATNTTNAVDSADDKDDNHGIVDDTEASSLDNVKDRSSSSFSTVVSPECPEKPNASPASAAKPVTTTPNTSPRILPRAPPDSSPQPQHSAVVVMQQQQQQQQHPTSPRSQNTTPTMPFSNLSLSFPPSPSTPVAPPPEIETKNGQDIYPPAQNFTFAVSTAWFYSHIIVFDYKARAQPDRWHRDANPAIYDLLGNAPQFPAWVSIAIREKQCYWGVRPGPRSENGRRHWYVKLTCRPGCPNTYQLYGSHTAFENRDPATVVWCEFAGDGRCVHRAGDKPRKRVRPNRRRGEGPFGSTGFPGDSASSQIGTPISPLAPLRASSSSPFKPMIAISPSPTLTPLKRRASLDTPISPSVPILPAPPPSSPQKPTTPPPNPPSKRPRPTLLTAPAYLNAAAAAQPASPAGPPGFLSPRYHYLGPSMSSPLSQSPAEGDDSSALFAFVFDLYEEGVLSEPEARFLTRLAVDGDPAMMVIWRSAKALEGGVGERKSGTKRVKMFLFGIRARFGGDFDALAKSAPTNTPPTNSPITSTPSPTTTSSTVPP